MSIYFTFLQLPKQQRQQNLLNLFDAINRNEDIEQDKIFDYPQFCTLLLDRYEQITSSPLIEKQHTTITRLISFATRLRNFIPNKDEDPNKHYYDFRIPKASGGLRLINAPEEDLKIILRDLKDFLQNTLHILPHNAAHAYVPNRSPLTALQRHQYNESKWFLKIDLKSFFPSCTEKFIHQQLSKIYPLNLMYASEQLKEVMQIIVKAACYHFETGYGLPQGTPLSPYLTNLLMVPIDYEIHNFCKQWKKQHFVYTRYADDIQISSKYNFNYEELKNEIQKIITANSPLSINTEKTRYGSNTGRNWNLGLMLNAENKLTIGYRRKRQLKQKLLNYCTKTEEWTAEDIRSFHGELEYFKHIEPEYAEHMLAEYSRKYNNNEDIITQMRARMS